tara:strand:- start:527 stop:709 length:183 start_codon:yes stop_codon:yes gene_type:complete
MATIKPCGLCGIKGIHACLGAPLNQEIKILPETRAEHDIDFWQAFDKATHKIYSDKKVNK